MTEGELKKLNRAELLAMLISVTQRCDELEIELLEAEEKLDSRDIEISRAGSLAEAALRINKVLEAADQAGAQYLANLQRMYPGDGSVDASQIIAATASMGGTSATEAETRARCQKIEAETRKRCMEMIENAKRDSQAYWDEVYKRIRRYSETMETLKKSLGKDTVEITEDGKE